MSKVLVLNASFEPLNITSWRRAIVLLLKEKAEHVEDQGRVLRSGITQPTVIRLRHYVNIPYREIPLTRRNILHRDSHTCQYCGYSGDDLTLDHIIPKSRGGLDTWDNIITACTRCNVKKGSRTPKEAGLFLRSTARRPYSSLHFEVSRQVNNGNHEEWRKYVIGI
jgi:5-methylcytosine-specific restriction endonuclease McrA